MTITLIIIGLLFGIVGFIGCLLPIIPGPPLSFAALIILSYAKDWEAFSWTLLIIMGGLMVMVSLLDYVVPALGAKKYGASKIGIWGSVLGLFIGLFVFPPFGIFIGGFVGAVAGELLTGKEGKKALRAGWGVFIGNLAGTGLKMAFSFFVIFLYVKAIL